MAGYVQSELFQIWTIRERIASKLESTTYKLIQRHPDPFVLNIPIPNTCLVVIKRLEDDIPFRTKPV